MNSTTPNNPPKLHNDVFSDFDVAGSGRNYGIALGVLTAVYLIIVNLLFGNGGEDEVGIPLGLRFAKHLLILPVVWMAIAAYAKSMPEGHVFKGALIFLGRIAIWSALTLALVNILFFLVTSSSFEQFLQEGETFFGVIMNSGLLIFETVVFVMILGFVILQAYKGKGSPED